MKPIVAIIGRPNVGKSTFFNRVTRSRNAIVDNRPGVTRDRNYGNVRWDDTEFTLVDTGGFLENDADAFAGSIQRQILQAVEDSDVIILIFDAKAGLSPFDADLLKMVRDMKKPIFYAVNKIDGWEQEHLLNDFYSLGVDKFYPISSEHGYGVNDFLDDVIQVFPEYETEASTDAIRVAVVGKPNVGKSSLINRILGRERLVVSDVPGTTRDAVDSMHTFEEKSYLLIDTAGIRRKGKVSKKIEKFSIIKSLRSLERCDVALIVIDASQGITDQDIHIAGYACDRGCGCIFLLNKWDLIEKDRLAVKRYIENLKSAARFLSFAPALTISAKTGLRVPKIFKLVDTVYDQYAQRINTGQLNRIIQNAMERNEPSLHRGRRIKFYYATQVRSKPPEFVCFVNYPDAVHFSYERYLINQIREEAGLDKTPLRIKFKQRTGKLTFKKKKR